MTFKFSSNSLSLAFRLVSFMSATAIAAFLLFSLIMISSVEKHFEELDMIDLNQAYNSLNTLITSSPPNLNKKIEEFNVEHRNLYIYLENENKQVFYETENPPFKLPANLLKNTTPDEKYKNDDYRILTSTITVHNQGEMNHYELLIIMSTGIHNHYLYDLKYNLLLASSIICGLIILLVYFAVYQGHTPLRKVSRTIANITSENLSTRLDPSQVPKELRELVISFNSTLEKIENVFIKQKNFSTDIAHEIRTPIANLMTQTQFAINQSRSIDEYQELMYSNLEEYERLAKMINDMLFLSQVDNEQQAMNKTMVNLRAEVNKVFDYFEAFAEEQNVHLALTGDNLSILGDASMIRRVINNLLSNAIRHTPAGKTITASITSKEERYICLTISNPGHPIPEEHLPYLFDRLYQVDRARQKKSDGCGIGLAIVKSIVEAHHGKVSVNSDIESTNFTCCFLDNDRTSLTKAAPQ